MTFPNFFLLTAELRKIPPRKDESLLSAAVAKILNLQHPLTTVPEFKLSPRDRIDFMCSGIGIELKTSGNSMEITRQCYRYADHLECLILISSKPVNLRSGVIRNSRGEACYLEVIELWNNPL